jgi:1,4-dihydroxy-2-naphthoate octaprenyltransferase
MSGVLHEWGVPFISMLIIGAVVKLMDDHLDAEYDICRGERTLSIKLGRAVLPYALILTLMAAYFQTSIAISLFLGSYAVGMFSGWREKLPTKVPGYIEILLAIAVSSLLIGPRLALWGVAMMALIDWLDDIVDMARDRTTGQDNVAIKFGTVETTFMVIVAMSLSVLLDPRLTIVGFIAFAVLTILFELTTTHLWTALDERGQH